MEPKPLGVLMAWRGQSDAGFVRVELWNSGKPECPHALKIETTAPPNSATVVGFLVDMPREVTQGLHIVQLFVKAPDEISYGLTPGPVVASISSEGVLRLFSIGTRLLITPCDLKPTP